MATVLDWVLMCAETDEFVGHYNRLRGSNLRFRPMARSPIERAVDRACGHAPIPSNDESELQAFVGHCVDLWMRIPVSAKA